MASKPPFSERLRVYAKNRWPLPLLHRANSTVRALSSRTHRWQLDLEWNTRPIPEWFDTYIGQHYTWGATRMPWIWDRGVYSVLGMIPGGRVLEICCGGGFFTYHFYSGRASEVVAVDFDKSAIAHARRVNAAPNIRYEICDIRQSLPPGPFDHIVWDGAIEHFTQQEIDSVLGRVKGLLTPGGALSGYTVQERSEGGKLHPDHEYEFKSKADLARFFEPYFRNVLVFEFIYPERHNLHFIASDGVVPFSPGWPSMHLSSR